MESKQTAQMMLEESVIGGMLLWNGPYPPEVLAVESEHFSDQQKAMCWDAILDLLEKREAIDEVTVTDRIKSWGESVGVYLFELAESTPTSMNLPIWARRLADVGRKKIYDERMRDVLNGNGTAEELVSRVEEISREARQGETSNGLVHIRQPLQELFKQLEQEYQNPDAVRKLKTGIPSLDRAAELRPGHLTILAGRPGMGKSALAGCLAKNCARKVSHNVVMFSLEMDDVSLIRRMVAAEAGVDSNLLVHTIGRNPDKVVNAFGKLRELNLWIDDRPGLSIPEMRAAMQRITDIDLCIVDYLQLSKTDNKLERQDLRIGAITQGLKGIAKDFDCHVLALSQLNRQVEHRTPPIPRMSDLRDSGNIEQDAENIWFVYRPGYYDEKKDQTDAQILIEKQRHGRKTIVHLKWNGNRQMFYEEHN